MSNRARRTRQIRFSALDFKVGLRMLARYPWLTTVGTVAIAVAIAIGSLYFEAINKWQNPKLPIRGADRVISIHNWDAGALQSESRSLHDFATWRQQSKTIEQMGAAITFVRNLQTEDRRIEAVQGAEISASAFTIMGTQPTLGRALRVQDEQLSEPPVLVISHALWNSRFGSDPDVVGRTVRLGTVTATIVGVMPEGFGFPRSARIWSPLRTDGSLIAPRTGPHVEIFGRLAPGASMSAAQTEMNVIASRLRATNPETHKNLSPKITGYARPLMVGGEAMFIRNLLYLLNGIFLLLLAIICTNVATLVFARTATRSWEIAVRNALGASRGRVVTQLFVEALVLAALGAVLGLLIARAALGFGIGMLVGSEGLPFWIDDSISFRTILYAGLLTIVGATIVGVLPALRVTKVNVQDSLRSHAAGARLKFGGFWTTVIVLQVAITVAFLPLAVGGVYESNRFHQRAEGIGAERYLVADISIDRENYVADSATFRARTRQRIEELEQRLIAEPGVEHVAFSDRLPVEDQFKYQIEVDTALAGAPSDGLRTSTLVHVSRGFFGAYGTSVVTGRDFAPNDFDHPRAMIVNQSFVRYVFGGRNAIGQRIRIVEGEVSSDAGATWYEIVGVVKDFGWQLPRPQEQSAMYLPALPVVGRAGQLAVRHRDPEAFVDRLRMVAADVDPTIRLTGIQPLTRAGGGEAQSNWALTVVAWLVSFIVLLLSATGIHALMSFIVARRTREIGIRTALGARPQRIIAGIFGRAILQISLGLVAGSALVIYASGTSANGLLVLLGVDMVMLIAGLTACYVPLRRALKIDPTEALRAEA